ncbi:MAG: type I 3-dehydroquinate dehydratase [Bacteroidales bacterium]|nr:type I 3-dehydroquinate dehydratase [Bacteroidales bacterium]
MICTVIHNKNFEQILEALEQCEMAEIRLDSCRMSAREIQECFSSDVPLIATCRLAELMASEPSLQDESMTQQSREIKAAQIAEKRLCQAIEAGARYVDVEIEAPKQMSKRVRNVAHENGTVFIRSYHDFEGTASVDALRTLVVKCHYHGADMVKVATMASSQEDAERVLSLYEWCGGMQGTDMENLADGGLIAFCMGEAGRESRLECLRRGAPFTYTALDGDEAVAPGQWSMSEMKAAVYGEAGHRYPQLDPLSVPCSKSFAQRAIIAAALADGVSHLRGYTPCGDNEAALAVARELGADVQLDGTTITIKGVAASRGLLSALGAGDHATVHVGESGLLARMVIPLMAQLHEGPVEVTGEKTLLKRPLTGAREILEAVGCGVKEILRCAQDDREDAVRIPLTVEGPLKSGGRVVISGKHGSQLITGLLMALSFAEKNTTLVVNDPKSIPYIFITLEVLKKFGVKIGNEMLGGRDFLESNGDWSLCTEMVFKVRGGQRLKATDIDLEGDWSAAANFLVAGAVFGKVEVAGLDTTSLQADLSIMDILMDAGASLSQVDGARGNIAVQRAPLRAFNVDASNCPDLFPVISVLAAFCQGTSRIAGLGRLANKESDRAKAILEMLSQMGVEAHRKDDELVVKGYSLVQRLLGQSSGESCQPGLLKGGEYTSHHDHRMVMALKVASLGADGPIVIDDEDCVAKSFPSFNEQFSLM